MTSLTSDGTDVENYKLDEPSLQYLSTEQSIYREFEQHGKTLADYCIITGSLLFIILFLT